MDTLKKRLEEEANRLEMEAENLRQTIKVISKYENGADDEVAPKKGSKKQMPTSKPASLKDIVLDIVAKHYPLDIDGMLAKARKHHHRRLKRSSVHSALYHLRKEGFVKRVRGKKGWYQPK
jgi:hypothetical protein